MSRTAAINYRQLFISLFEALPLPAFVVDRDMLIHYINTPARQFCQVPISVRKTKIDAVLRVPALLQLLQECIRTSSSQQRQYEKGDSDITWNIAVAPLIHQSVAKKAEANGEAESYPRYFAV